MMNELTAKYVGIPYKPKGKTREEGMDCVTLLAAYYRELGYDPKVTEYEYDGKWLVSNLRLFNKEISRLEKEGKVIKDIRDVKLNDLLCFSFKDKIIDMLGIYAGDRLFLHMPHVGKSSLSTLTDYWKSKFKFAVRLIQCP